MILINYNYGTTEAADETISFWTNAWLKPLIGDKVRTELIELVIRLRQGDAPRPRSRSHLVTYDLATVVPRIWRELILGWDN